MISLFISVKIHGCLFYIWGYCPMLLYLLGCSSILLFKLAKQSKAISPI